MLAKDWPMGWPLCGSSLEGMAFFFGHWGETAGWSLCGSHIEGVAVCVWTCGEGVALALWAMGGSCVVVFVGQDGLVCSAHPCPRR